MKVMLCIASMGKGGAERQLAYLSKALVDEGCEVHVVLLRRGENFERLLKSGSRVYLLEYRNTNPLILFALVKLFKGVSPDIVYLWQRPFDIFGACAALLTRIPYLYAERTNPYKLTTGIKVWLRLLLAQSASGIIANSHMGVSYWEGRMLLKNRVYFMPNIVPIDELLTAVQSEESQGCIVCVGRMDRNKNQMLLLRAIEFLNRRGTSIKLMLVGDGPERAHLIEFVAQHNLRDLVNVQTFRNDAWGIMKGAIGFVSLSRVEGEPNAALEAAALGCPLLLSDIPEHRSVFSGSGVIFVDTESIDDVSASLEHLVNIERNNTGQSELFNQRTPQIAARQYQKLIGKIIGRSQ